MFDHIFENRDRKVTNIIKLSDYLGRSLRENVEVFSIDDTDERVTFVTESGKIIAGSYDFKDGICLNNIQVEDGELFENTESFDEFVDYKISDFIHNIFEEDFADADTSFNKVLQLWESRVKFTSVKKKLYEKSQKFNGTNRIIESDEFQRLVEIAPQVVTFLKENKNLINIPEINNMVRLSSSVSKAFDLPRLTLDKLDGKNYTISEENNHTLYEMICKQELIRKELVESKNNFDLVWLNNEKISNLAGLIYEKEEKVIAKALVGAICEVPYLALATKRQIMETLTNNLELTDTIKVNIKDIKSFSSLLFEYKKPLKTLFVAMLNEKYGISVQNLKDIPTFKSLLNTQVLIFEALAKLSPKGSVLKETLSEGAKMLKGKNGVESIDVNQFVELLFDKADYLDILDDDPLVDVISLKETFSELESIEELIDLVLDRLEESDPHRGEPDDLAARRRANMIASDIKSGSKPEEAGERGETQKEKKKKKKTEKRRTTGGGESPQYGAENAETELGDEPSMEEDGDKGYPGIKGGTEEAEEEEKKRKKKKRKDEEEDQEDTDTAVEEPSEEESEEQEKEIPTSSEIMSSFKNFEDILNSIDFDEIVGDEDEEEEAEEAEKEAEVDKEEEGEE